MEKFLLAFLFCFFNFISYGQKSVVYYDTELSKDLSIGLGHSIEGKYYIFSLIKEGPISDFENLEFIVNGDNILDQLTPCDTFLIKDGKKKKIIEYDYKITLVQLFTILNDIKHTTRVFIFDEMFLGEDIYNSLNDINNHYVLRDIHDEIINNMPPRKRFIAKKSHIRFGRYKGNKIPILMEKNKKHLK